MNRDDADAARPLHIAAPGFASDPRIRRMLELSGWRLSLGWPGRGGTVGVWGRKPPSILGRELARLSGAGLLTIEDGFLRSVQPGVSGEAPLSISLDPEGVYYDARRPSRLEELIRASERAGPETLARARAGMARLRELGLSKYTPVPRGTGNLPEPGYVLVIDQTAGDASIAYGGATAESFGRMLDAARAEHPGRRIVIRTHPDIAFGKKRGHFSAATLRPGESLFTEPANPWDVIEGADAVYAVTSQMGFEAVLAGREVHVFGLPFYAGWGLTRDRMACLRRGLERSAEQVFTAAYLDFPIYYDPWADRLTGFEETVETLTRLLPFRQSARDCAGEVYAGFSPWKRRNCLRYARPHRLPPRFVDDEARAIDLARQEDRRVWFWASRYEPDALDRAAAAGVPAGAVEDGFLRSVGLGATLIDAASLVFDAKGIYYDPGRPSCIEDLIAEAAGFGPDDPRLARAAALRDRIVRARITKYNIGRRAAPEGIDGRTVVLVPGQVEDDASIRRGTGEVRTNLALLEAARAARPDAFLIYKPHPDVEAGLRLGKVPPERARALADHVAEDASPADLLDIADELWTMTSLMGFEALLRGIPVTCLGAPFYAGWGLTGDRGPVPERRRARPSLDGLVWATLIAYPAYVDPVSKLPCTPEVAVDRLAAGVVAKGGTTQRLTSKGQDLMAALGLVWWR